MGTGGLNAVVTLRCISVPSRGGGGEGIEILLVTSCYRNQDNKLQPGGLPGSYADFPSLGRRMD